MRVPASKHCVVKSQKHFSEYSQNFAIKDWENNYNCGGKMTMTFNPYGSWNSDRVSSVYCCCPNIPRFTYLQPPLLQIYNIDEEAACKDCAAQLKTDGYISSGSCVVRGVNEWKVKYTPKRTYTSVTKCDPEVCKSSTVTCTVAGAKEKVKVNRNGAWSSEKVSCAAWYCLKYFCIAIISLSFCFKHLKVYDIPWGWSWEDSAKKCCEDLKRRGYVSSCGSHWKNSLGMYMKYVGTRSCTQRCWNESVETGCGLEYNIGCGGEMNLARYERCQSSGEDTVR